MRRTPAILALAATLLAAVPAVPARPVAAPARPPASARPPEPLALERVAEVPLPGPPTRFDYQSLDPAADRLYLSHMGAGEVLVFDVAARRVAGSVRGLPGVTGVCVVPAWGRLYASATGRHAVAVIDSRTLRVIAWAGPIGFPDGIAAVPEAGKVYVSDESGGGELVLDGRTGRVVTRIPLGGEAGNTLYDPASRRILVAVQTRNEWVEIDPATDRVRARHPLPGAAHPHGMALDLEDRLLFVASEERTFVQTVDLRTRRVTGQEPVGEDPDVLAYDAGDRRLFVAAESGVVCAFTVAGRALRPAGRITLPHAHTVSVDAHSHLVYLPLQDAGGRPVLWIGQARRR